MRKSTLLGIMLAGTAFPIAPAWSQSGEDSGEIIVTAQKREQSIQDIPVSITALGGEDLRRLQANDVSTIANQVSNVVATTSVNLPAFTIRGIGLNEFASNFDSPVAVHIDEVYKSKPYMVSIPFFDIQRVEALKGPQGTLFGRNTTGGSVNFYTYEPQMRDEAGVNLSYDNFSRGRLDGYFNKVLSDQFAVRASYFVYAGEGGPYHNRFTQREYGAPEQFAGRLQALWKGDGLKVRLTAYGFRDKTENPPYKSPGLFNPDGTFCSQLFDGTLDKNRSACLKYGPFVPDPNDTSGLRETQDVREANANNLWLTDNTAYGTSLRIEKALGSADLVSITSYDYFERIQTEDSDNTPYKTVDTNYWSKITQFTQELRVSGKTGKLTYLVGGFFEHDKINEMNSALLENPLIGLPPTSPRFAGRFQQKVRSIAAFTHNEFEIVPSVSIVAGIRYTNDRTSLVGSTYLGANDPAGKEKFLTPVIPVDELDDSRTDETVSFRAGVNWNVDPDHLLYASVSRGFRSGGYSVPFGGVITSFDPEQLTAYEIGYKGRLIDRTLDLNLAVFRYDYKDIQTNVDDPVSPVVPITRNIGNARTYGAEGDITWRPFATSLARLAVGYLDAKVVKSDRVVTTYAGPVPLDGKPLVNSPKWTIQAFLQQRFPIGDDLEVIAQTDGKYVSKRYLESTAQIFDRADSYWVQNARLTLANSNAGWEFAIWGKNIFDKEYLTYINNVSFFRLEIYGEPASYGLSANFKF